MFRRCRLMASVQLLDWKIEHEPSTNSRRIASAVDFRPVGRYWHRRCACAHQAVPKQGRSPPRPGSGAEVTSTSTSSSPTTSVGFGSKPGPVSS